jgi:hypothetical protein
MDLHWLTFPSPHGECFLWNVPFIATDVITQSLIGIAYFAIGVLCATILRSKRFDVFQQNWIATNFGLFVFFCGVHHFIEVENIFRPDFYFALVEDIVLAYVSLVTMGGIAMALRNPPKDALGGNRIMLVRPPTNLQPPPE